MATGGKGYNPKFSKEDTKSTKRGENFLLQFILRELRALRGE
jgi:hypothetical protein